MATQAEQLLSAHRQITHARTFTQTTINLVKTMLQTQLEYDHITTDLLFTVATLLVGVTIRADPIIAGSIFDLMHARVSLGYSRSNPLTRTHETANRLQPEQGLHVRTRVR
jgi:hypothetical protein